MKVRDLSISLISLAATASVASATQILYEPFNYTSGSGLNGQSPDGGTNTWAEAGTTTTSDGDSQPTIASGNLAVPAALPAASGNLAELGGEGSAERINFTAITTIAPSSTSVFYSFSLQVNDLGNLPSSGSQQILAGFNNSIGTQKGIPSQIGAALWIHPAGGTSTTSFNLGTEVSVNNGTSDDPVAYGSPSYNTGDTLFVVGAYNFGSPVTSQLWVYDLTAGDTVPTAQPGSDTADDSNSAGIGSSIASFLLYQTGSTSSPTLGQDGVNLDELRIGMTWTDVNSGVPEPASASIVGIASVALLARRRRR